MTELWPCRDCGAHVGALHTPGCDVERCRLCGGQSISCGCVRDFGPSDRDSDLEPDDVMWSLYDADIAKHGGRLPWTGEWPGAADCRELGLWSRWVEGKGWEKCGPNDPGAGEDLNELNAWSGIVKWDRDAGKWVRRQRAAR